MIATTQRLVPIGANAREVRRHAFAIGATALEGDCEPITWRFGQHSPQPGVEVVCQLCVVLKDQGERLPAPSFLGAHQCPEVRGGHTDRPRDPAHVDRGSLLGLLDTEIPWHKALFSDRFQLAWLGEVHTENALCFQTKALEVRHHFMPTSNIRRKVQDVYRQIVQDPFLCPLRLGGCCVEGPAKNRTLAQRGIQQWLERPLVRVRRLAHLREALLCLPPSPMALCPKAALELHPSPTPIATPKIRRPVGAVP
mmetsp:Transcript_115989/g.247931  ORF Transcript_115989/g.247931 Transcript_115989/m.247931 type:complete len:253 (-) Transcript_115989:1563-2321(-)